MKKMFILLLVSMASQLAAMESEYVKIAITNSSPHRIDYELYQMPNLFTMCDIIEPGETKITKESSESLMQIIFSTPAGRSSITWVPADRKFYLELNNNPAIQLPIPGENPQLYLTIDLAGITRGSLAKPAAEKEHEAAKSESSGALQFLIENNLIDLKALSAGFQRAIDNYFGPDNNASTEKTFTSELLSFTDIASKINHNIIDPNQVVRYNEPILNKASETKMVNFVNYLILRGANLNSMNDHSDTPISHAAISIIIGMDPDEALQIIDILLKAKADPNIYTDTPPLIRLLRSDKPAAPKAVELLLKYGANPELPDKRGKTAYDYLQATGPAFNIIKKRLQRTHYTILGINRNASTAEIKQAYRDLALKRHPDKAASFGLSPDQAQRQFIEIKDAYDTLSDPDKRAYYDQTIK